MGMTLQQVLDEVKERYPEATTLTDESLVRKLNNLQAELFRTIYRPVVSFYTDILEGIYVYPISFSPSKITGVILDGIEVYERQAKGNDVPRSQFYYFEDENLCLYPTPEKDITDGLSVFHYQEPYVLRVGDGGKYPDFDPDFHMMLVYGLLVACAETVRDVDGMRDAFVASYNEMERSFLKAQEKAEYHVIQDFWGVFP